MSLYNFRTVHIVLKRLGLSLEEINAAPTSNDAANPIQIDNNTHSTSNKADDFKKV